MSLIELIAYGAMDCYLTGNPQISFFKHVYRRHFNFDEKYTINEPKETISDYLDSLADNRDDRCSLWCKELIKKEYGNDYYELVGALDSCDKSDYVKIKEVFVKYKNSDSFNMEIAREVVETFNL